MKKVIITGGAGTVGTAFIKEYYNDYEFYSLSRGEEQIAELKNNFPKVTTLVRDVCNLDQLISTFESIRPDIVIHSAAMKHVNLAEVNPTTAVNVNLNGSLNVIKASIRAEVPITVGVSTDKACAPENVYGYTKKIMEMMFAEHHNSKTKFVCTRFANVANSRGSVIPFFKKLAANKEPLKLTSVDMNRLMFSKAAAAELIHDAIYYASLEEESFVLSTKMKSVNMLNLANQISDDIEIVGLRPGEKLNENLISKKELPYTKVVDNLIFLFEDKQPIECNLNEPFSSQNAVFMSSDELIKLITE